ncbi:MAG: nucleotidyltransferase family protein [Acidobacteria bacterium]|nr:MAG: nucleotidyltransferase family protein [Acidobacteriota bacterium]
MPDTTKAVILARGLGTRMRRAAEAAAIDASQAAAADSGVKAMIPIGRPFLDYVLSALADAGCRQACLVIGPEHDAIRRYYTLEAVPARISVSFAIQEKPLGTADAVLAAEAFAGDDGFLALNSDNYYPVHVLARLRALGRPGLAGFDPRALVRDSNIDPARVQKYAILSIGADGFLADIIEKPDEETWRAAGGEALISMNCWSFGPAIFEAARRIAPSARGELELADAVRYAIERLGERFAVLPVAAGVLDLSVRTDIPAVARRLREVDVRP